ncbi:hypothetical protein BJ6T_38830 [Bradyrhizobium japonicum USDA 6]|nr:hypothetical protein BJ6T_38830 [Bradyrhizobium japonicum USDA 6]
MAAAINRPRRAISPRSTASRRKSRIEGPGGATRCGSLRVIARSFGLYAARRLARLVREPLLNPGTRRARRLLDGKEGLAVLPDQRSLRRASHEMKGAVAARALVYL